MAYHVDGHDKAKQVSDHLHHEHGDWRKHGRLGHRHGVHGIGPTGDPTVVGNGGTGVALDPAEFANAEQLLARCSEELTEHITKANQLVHPMGQGHGPVADTMAEAFTGRAADADGLVRILAAYRDQVEQVRDAIRDTMTSYQTIEDSIVSTLNNQTNQGA